MKTRPLQILLHVERDSVIELELGDEVQLDRLTETPEGIDAERHGPLLAPGTNTIALPPGDYAMQTLCDAELRVVMGGVSSSTAAAGKDDWPDPPPKKLLAKGDAPGGETPRLLVRSR